MNDQTASKIQRMSAQGKYLHSRGIGIGGCLFSMQEAIVTAPHIAGLNVYMVGGTGEGKTELANDMAGIHGDGYCYAEGRPDFELNELLKQLNLQGIKTAKTDRELRQLTDNVKKTLYYVDELNRCPPIVMNYFFNFFDGKLVHDGKALKLGRNGYSVGYASGNIGNGAYVGVSDTDRALKDRMNLIVKLDDPDFCTTELDDVRIFASRKRPRASMPDEGRVCIDDILSVHEEFKTREIPVVLPLIGVYLHKGLDWLDNTRRHSKRAIADKWPNVEAVRKDTDEGMIMPLSKRAVLATIAYSQALGMIAEAKGQEVPDQVGMFLDALKFTVPYSGVLPDNFVQVKHYGDVYAAYEEIMDGIKGEFSLEKRQAMEEAVSAAAYGAKDEAALDVISPTGEGKWACVRRAVEMEVEAGPGEGQTMDELLTQLSGLDDSNERTLWQIH